MEGWGRPFVSTLKMSLESRGLSIRESNYCVGDGDGPVVVIGYCYEVEAKVIVVVGWFVGDEEGP